MKKILLPILGLFLIAFSSCKEIQPVTISGIENPKLQKLSREGIEFDFGMKIRNPNGIGVTVFPSVFEVTINDIDGGKIKLSKRVRIKAKSDDTPEFHIKSDFSKLGFGDLTKVMDIVSTKRATVTIKGYVKVGKWYYKKKFPVEMTKTINLSK